MLPRRVRRQAEEFFFPPLPPPPPLSLLLFEVWFRGADKRAGSGGILNGNKNQLGRGLGAAGTGRCWALIGAAQEKRLFWAFL